MTRLAWLYALLLAFAAAWLGWGIAQGGRLQTDLTALLPADAQVDAVWRAADEAGEKQLNGQILLLVGSEDADRAFSAAEQVADRWQQSGLFAAVDSRLNPDLAQLRQEIRRLGVNALPREQQQLLLHDPAAYFQQRAEDAANPFAAQIVPLEDDWLGFARFVQQKQPSGRLQWHSGNGMMYSEQDGITWVWLRARLPEKAAADQAERLLPLLADSRAQAEHGGYRLLAAGGALFAAEAKTQSERESGLMSAIGLSLTFALLLAVFRSPRVFALVLPLGAGMLLGAAAVVGAFGQIHILTVVIGTSLVGMLVDFPLHWLAPSVFGPSEKTAWQAEPAMKHVLPSFAVSLAITVLGYALLWFTPLPVLRQTAVFSGFALFGAFGATVLWLPLLFRRYRARTVPFAELTERLHALSGRLKARLHKRGWLAVGGILLAVGLWRSDWRDDIRQWVNMPSEMLAEVQRIGQLSGADFGGKYLVAEAPSEDALLMKTAELGRALQPLVAQGKLGGFQSPDQLLMPVSEQQKLQNRLRELAKLPESWQAMRDIGIPRKTVRDALLQAADAPPLTLSDGLNTDLSEAWRPLYLGEVEQGRFAAVVRISGMTDEAAVRAAAQSVSGVHWADKRAHLNELFHHTRNQAAWLKLASYALAWFLLWRMFGMKRGSKILAVPLAAAVCTVAVLGWAGIPVSLFAMFGLLLVSAIGVDYAVYAVTAKHSAPARLGGMLLAAATTAISFALLALSGTPAVAAFGITVTVGVAFNIWLARTLLKD